LLKNLTREKKNEGMENHDSASESSSLRTKSEEEREDKSERGLDGDDTHNSHETDGSTGFNALPGTVFADPSNFSIKHPLQNKWSLWYDNPRKKTQDTWGSHLKKVADFDTVEDFWRLYNNLMPASQLIHGSDYHLFKHGIEPSWEDAANAKGGKWTFNVNSKQRNDKLDSYWLYTMLACIGEAFGDDEDEICGAVVSIRKAQDRIALWTKTASKEVQTRLIGRIFKRALELPENVVLGYQSHADSMKRTSSFPGKPRYEV